VNPAAIPETLLESTLFGHRKGAFTDAKDDRPGIFEAAGEGTVFLDEIGEMDRALQTRLLRVLQESKVIRLGDVTEIPVEARVIAATNRDLKAAIQAGEFRQDLFYRLSVFTIEVPPLRSRREDIPLLASFFLEMEKRRIGKNVHQIEPSAVDALMRYNWPGNVRELKNVIHSAIIRASGDVITRELLILGGESSASPDSELAARSWREAGLLFERDYFTKLLERYQGNKSKAAAVAGINRTVLYEHLRKLGLDSR
jgi:transcriptional regulator with PAS, ATPase and Fis domain